MNLIQEMEKRRQLINEENKIERAKIISSIEHNKRIMSLYDDRDKQIQLLIENINLYQSLKMFKHITKFKPLSQVIEKKQIQEPEFDNYVSKDITLQDFGIYSYDSYLIDNK